MRAAIAALLLFAVAGCATRAHLRYEANFVAAAPGEFVYVSRTTLDAPDTPSYEAMRRALIEEAVNERRYCPNGFDVVERKVETSASGRHIHYRGRCRA